MCSSYNVCIIFAYKASIDVVSAICILAMKWYLMRMYAGLLCSFNSKLNIKFNGSVRKYRVNVTVLAHACARQDKNLRQNYSSYTFYEHIDNQSQRKAVIINK